MKHFIILVITFYQYTISPFIKQTLGVRGMCRYNPSCSAYAKNSIEKYGIIKGSYLALRRLLRCQPWFTGNNS